MIVFLLITKCINVSISQSTVKIIIQDKIRIVSTLYPDSVLLDAIYFVINNRLKNPLWSTRRPQRMTSLIILTGQHMKVTVGIYFSVLGVNVFLGCVAI